MAVLAVSAAIIVVEAIVVAEAVVAAEAIAVVEAVVAAEVTAVVEAVVVAEVAAEADKRFLIKNGRPLHIDVEAFSLKNNITDNLQYIRC